MWYDYIAYLAHAIDEADMPVDDVDTPVADGPALLLCCLRVRVTEVAHHARHERCSLGDADPAGRRRRRLTLMAHNENALCQTKD